VEHTGTPLASSPTPPPPPPPPPPTCWPANTSFFFFSCPDSIQLLWWPPERVHTGARAPAAELLNAGSRGMNQSQLNKCPRVPAPAPAHRFVPVQRVQHHPLLAALLAKLLVGLPLEG